MLHRLAPIACTGVIALAAPVHAGLIFSQDFSASGNVADYVSTPGTSSTFDDISALGGTSVGIVSEALVVTGPLTGAPSPNGGGFFRQDIGGAVAPTLMVVQYTLTVDWDGSQSHGNAAAFKVGDISSGPVYGTYFAPGGAATVGIDLQGSQYGVKFGGASVSIAKGTAIQVTLYLNHSGLDQLYTAVDGSSRTLDDGAGTLFIGTTLLDENAGLASPNFADIHFAGGINPKSTAVSYIFDDIAVYDGLVIPEPASLALLCLGGSLVTPRRRR